MSETCWEVIDADISHWGGWCRFFATSDGRFFIVDADLEKPAAWITTVIRRNTAVFWCSSGGGVIDLVADYEYAPMTTPEQAIALMGYELIARPDGYTISNDMPIFSIPVTDEGATA
jgi:hypothetical protein